MGAETIGREEGGVPVEALDVKLGAEVLREGAESGEFAGVDAPVEDGLEVRRERNARSGECELRSVEAELDGSLWRDVAAALHAGGEREAGGVGESAGKLWEGLAEG